MAACLVGLAAVLDFFDGFAARLLKVSSPIGKDLDSLADVVTFGVVPGLVLYKMVSMGPGLDKEGFLWLENYPQLAYLTFIVPILSAVRLAKFNNDTRQSESFIGLPTPANGILICSVPLIVGWNENFSYTEYNHFQFLLHPITLLIASVILSLLLIAELPLFALKFKHFHWKGNEIRYSFLGFSLLLLIMFRISAIPMIIFSYLVFSLVQTIISKKNA